MQLKKVSGTYSLPYSFRAGWTTHLVFSIIFGALTVFGLFVAFKKPAPGVWFFYIVPLLMWGASLIYFYFLKIVLQEERIISGGLFAKTRTALYRDITQLELKVGAFSEEGRLKSAFYELNIFCKGLMEPLKINIKPYGERDLAILFDAITTKNPAVKMDELTSQMKEGNFAPVVSVGVRNMWQIGLFLFLVMLIVSIIKIVFHLAR